ncbi:MAG TPA: hypothetical protein VIN40_01330 [Candidatus Tyrphobacter sp.]
MELRSRYHEILSHRAEGLAKYGGRLTSDIYGPPWRIAFPRVTLKRPSVPHAKIGPLYVADNPPVLDIVHACAAGLGDPLGVVEIGPGKGVIATVLRAKYAAKISRYYGLEIDEAVSGAYERIASPQEIEVPIGLVVASQVIEHMPPDAFFGGILEPLLPKLTADAAVVVGTPNALAPSSMFGDFTHVQAYAWYDLYALLRLFFESVDVVRTRYVWSAGRLVWLLPRMLLTRALELDWCEEIVCIGKRPRRSG